MQLALMADAMDEAMMVVRFADTEAYDTSKLELVCNNFVDRASMLFEKGRCWEFGYTKFMCDELKKPVVLFVRGEAITVGGVGPSGCPNMLLF